jgi:hypothetical protein
MYIHLRWFLQAEKAGVALFTKSSSISTPSTASDNTLIPAGE